MDWSSYLRQLGPPAVFTEQTVARDGTATVRTIQYQPAPFAPQQQPHPALAPGGQPYFGGQQHLGGQQYPPMQYGFSPQQQLALPYPTQQFVPQYPNPQYALPYHPTQQFVPQHQSLRAIPKDGSQSRITPTPTPHSSTDEDVYLKKLRKSVEDQLADPQVRSSFTRQEADLGVMASILEKCHVAKPDNTTAMFGNGELVLAELRRDPNGRRLLFFDDERVRNDVGNVTLDQVLEEKLVSAPSAELDVQNPRLPYDVDSTERYTLQDIRRRLKEASDTKFPLNMLSFKPADCQAVTPWFLRGDDFKFLDEIRSEWRTHNKDKAEHLLHNDPTKWATFAESSESAAALTPPHMDIDGHPTFLYVVQGRLGIIYHDAPSDDQVAEFLNAPKTLPSDIVCRIKVLSPGQGVYMPAGTIHAVVRLPGDEHSLTFGGHVLRADQLPRCIELCDKQMQFPGAVNEDPFATSLPYIIQAGKQLVQAKKKNPGTYEVKFGGAASIAAFWRNMAKIDEKFTECKIKDARTFTYRHRLDLDNNNHRAKSRKRPAAERAGGGSSKKQNLSTAQRPKQNSTQNRRVSKRTSVQGEASEKEPAS